MITKPEPRADQEEPTEGGEAVAVRPPIRLADITIQRYGRQEAMTAVLRSSEDRPVRVVWIYANCVNVATKNPSYLRAIQHSEFVLNDGAGIELAGRMLGRPVLDNLIGTDWIPDFLDRFEKTDSPDRRVFLLGGRAEVISDAARAFEDRWKSLELTGSCHGYHEEPEAMLRPIEDARPHLLILGMGVPKQEIFLDRHWTRLQEAGVRVALAGGAILDHIAGAVPRAPQWVRTARCEWIYRLVHEPRRLWRRYLIGNLRFLVLLLREWRGSDRRGGPMP